MAFLGYRTAAIMTARGSSLLNRQTTWQTDPCSVFASLVGKVPRELSPGTGFAAAGSALPGEIP